MTNRIGIDRVLAPLAMSGRAVAVAKEARRLADVLGAKLTLLHVGPDTDDTRSAFASVVGGEADKQSLVFHEGRPDSVICKVAKEIGAGLIVAGAMEREGPVGYYVGSVARRIARRAHCSVLLLTEPRSEPAPFSGWVVCVDYDTRGDSTLRFALELARLERPRWLDAAYEYELPAFGLAAEQGLDQYRANVERDRIHRDELAKLVERLAGFDAGEVALHPVCLRGREGWEAAEHARRRGADLLIAPAPKRLSFFDKFFQHGVEFVLESLPCALWLYREPK